MYVNFNCLHMENGSIVLIIFSACRALLEDFTLESDLSFRPTAGYRVDEWIQL